MNLAWLRVDSDRDHGAGLPGHTDREVKRVRMSHRVDRGVNAAAGRESLDGFPWVVLGQMYRRRAKRSRQVEPLLDAVDRDDGARSGRPRHLHRAQPDRTEAQHGDVVAGFDVGLQDGVVAGAHHVAREQRHLVRDPLGHLA